MNFRRTLLLVSAFGLLAMPGLAAELVLAPTRIVEMKAVVGRIEARDVIPARSRIGGTLVRLQVTEGERLVEGQSIATVIDDKLALQLRAAEARIRALGSEQGNVQAEYERARTLLERGAGTQQRVDALRTQQDVIRNQISAAEADKSVIIQQASEGEVLAPVAGRVLKVPVTRGAVVMPGEIGRAHV
jgi:multidrug efflux pump subunit AcrA (membrane-fusion protein)